MFGLSSSATTPSTSPFASATTSTTSNTTQQQNQHSSNGGVVLETLLQKGSSSDGDYKLLKEMTSSVAVGNMFGLYRPLPISSSSSSSSAATSNTYPSTLFTDRFKVLLDNTHHQDNNSTANNNNTSTVVEAVAPKLNAFISGTCARSNKIGQLLEMSLKSFDDQGDVYTAPKANDLYEASHQEYTVPSALSQVADEISTFVSSNTTSYTTTSREEAAVDMEEATKRWARMLDGAEGGGVSTTTTTSSVPGFTIETFSKNSKQKSRPQIRSPEALEKTFHHILQTFVRCPRLPTDLRTVFNTHSNSGEMMTMTGVDVSNVNLDVYRFVESRFRGLVKDWTMMVDPNVEPSMCPTDTLDKLLRSQELHNNKNKNSDFIVTDELLRHGYHGYLNERRAAVHEAMIRYHLISSVLATQGRQREAGDSIHTTIFPISSSSSSSMPPKDISIPVINSKCFEFGSLVKVDLLAAIESNFSYLTNHYRYKNSANMSSSSSSSLSSQNIKEIESTNEMISILIFVHCMHLKDKAESNAGFCRFQTQTAPGAFEAIDSAVHLDFTELGYLRSAGHSPEVRSIMMLILCIKNGEYVRFFEIFAALSSSSSPSSSSSTTADTHNNNTSSAELSTEDIISQAADDLCAFGAAGGAISGGAVAALSHHHHNNNTNNNTSSSLNKKKTTTTTGSKIPFVLHKLTLCQKAVVYKVFTFARFRAIMGLLSTFIDIASNASSPSSSSSSAAPFIPIRTLSTMLLFNEHHNDDDDDENEENDEVTRYADCLAFIANMGLRSFIQYHMIDEEDDNGEKKEVQQLVLSLLHPSNPSTSSSPRIASTSDLEGVINLATDGRKTALMFPASTELFYHLPDDDDEHDADDDDDNDDVTKDNHAADVRRQFLCPLSPVEFIDRYLVSPLLGGGPSTNAESGLFSTKAYSALVGVGSHQTGTSTTTAAMKRVRSLLAASIGLSTYGQGLIQRAGYSSTLSDDDDNKSSSSSLKRLFTASTTSNPSIPPMWVDMCAVIDASLPPTSTLMDMRVTPLVEDRVVLSRSGMSPAAYLSSCSGVPILSPIFTPICPSVELSCSALSQRHTLTFEDATGHSSSSSASMISSRRAIMPSSSSYHHRLQHNCESETDEEDHVEDAVVMAAVSDSDNNINKSTTGAAEENDDAATASAFASSSGGGFPNNNKTTSAMSDAELIATTNQLVQSLDADMTAQMEVVEKLRGNKALRAKALEDELEARRQKYAAEKEEKEEAEAMKKKQQQDQKIAADAAAAAAALKPSSPAPPAVVSASSSPASKFNFSFGGRGAPTAPSAIGMSDGETSSTHSGVSGGNDGLNHSTTSLFASAAASNNNSGASFGHTKIRPEGFFSTKPPEAVAGITSASSSSTTNTTISVKSLFGGASSNNNNNKLASNPVSPTTTTTGTPTNRFFGGGGLGNLAPVSAPGFGDDVPTPPTPLVGFAKAPDATTTSQATAAFSGFGNSNGSSAGSSLFASSPVTAGTGKNAGFSFVPSTGVADRPVPGGSPMPFKPMPMDPSDGNPVGSRRRRVEDDPTPHQTMPSAPHHHTTGSSSTNEGVNNDDDEDSSIPSARSDTPPPPSWAAAAPATSSTANTNPFLSIAPMSSTNNNPFLNFTSKVTEVSSSSATTSPSLFKRAGGGGSDVVVVASKGTVSEPASDISSCDLGEVSSSSAIIGGGRGGVIAAPPTPLFTTLINGTRVEPVKLPPPASSSSPAAASPSSYQQSPNISFAPDFTTSSTKASSSSLVAAKKKAMPMTPQPNTVPTFLFNYMKASGRPMKEGLKPWDPPSPTTANSNGLYNADLDAEAVRSSLSLQRSRQSDDDVSGFGVYGLDILESSVCLRVRGGLNPPALGGNYANRPQHSTSECPSLFQCEQALSSSSSSSSSLSPKNRNMYKNFKMAYEKGTLLRYGCSVEADVRHFQAVFNRSLSTVYEIRQKLQKTLAQSPPPPLSSSSAYPHPPAVDESNPVFKSFTQYDWDRLICDRQLPVILPSQVELVARDQVTHPTRNNTSERQQHPLADDHNTAADTTVAIASSSSSVASSVVAPISSTAIPPPSSTAPAPTSEGVLVPPSQRLFNLSGNNAKSTTNTTAGAKRGRDGNDDDGAQIHQPPPKNDDVSQPTTKRGDVATSKKVVSIVLPTTTTTTTTTTTSMATPARVSWGGTTTFADGDGAKKSTTVNDSPLSSPSSSSIHSTPQRGCSLDSSLNLHSSNINADLSVGNLSALGGFGKKSGGFGMGNTSMIDISLGNLSAIEKAPNDMSIMSNINNDTNIDTTTSASGSGFKSLLTQNQSPSSRSTTTFGAGNNNTNNHNNSSIISNNTNSNVYNDVSVGGGWGGDIGNSFLEGLTGTTNTGVGVGTPTKKATTTTPTTTTPKKKTTVTTTTTTPPSSARSSTTTEEKKKRNGSVDGDDQFVVPADMPTTTCMMLDELVLEYRTINSIPYELPLYLQKMEYFYQMMRDSTLFKSGYKNINNARYASGYYFDNLPFHTDFPLGIEEKDAYDLLNSVDKAEMDAVIQDTRQRYSFVSSPGVMVLPLSEIKIEVMSRPVTYAGRRRRDTAHIKTTIQQAAPLLVEVVNVQLALIFLESSSSFSSSTSSSKNQKTQKNQKRIISPDDVKNHITALIKSLAQKEVLAGVDAAPWCPPKIDDQCCDNTLFMTTYVESKMHEIVPHGRFTDAATAMVMDACQNNQLHTEIMSVRTVDCDGECVSRVNEEVIRCTFPATKEPCHTCTSQRHQFNFGRTSMFAPNTSSSSSVVESMLRYINATETHITNTTIITSTPSSIIKDSEESLMEAMTTASSMLAEAACNIPPEQRGNVGWNTPSNMNSNNIPSPSTINSGGDGAAIINNCAVTSFIENGSANGGSVDAFAAAAHAPDISGLSAVPQPPASVATGVVISVFISDSVLLQSRLVLDDTIPELYDIVARGVGFIDPVAAKMIGGSVFQGKVRTAVDVLHAKFPECSTILNAFISSYGAALNNTGILDGDDKLITCVSTCRRPIPSATPAFSRLFTKHRAAIEGMAVLINGEGSCSDDADDVDSDTEVASSEARILVHSLAILARELVVQFAANSILVRCPNLLKGVSCDAVEHPAMRAFFDAPPKHRSLSSLRTSLRQNIPLSGVPAKNHHNYILSTDINEVMMGQSHGVGKRVVVEDLPQVTGAVVRDNTLGAVRDALQTAMVFDPLPPSIIKV